MNRKTVAYKGILLLVLIFASVILNRGVIQGVASNSDVTLTTAESTHLLGQIVVYNATLTFAQDEQNSLSRVRLVNSAGVPQPLDIDLPVVDTTSHSLADANGFIDISGETSATDDVIKVKVTFNNIQTLGGTLPSTGTLPGTLPTVEVTVGGNFTGGSGGGTISYVVHWTPPVFLDPVPSLTLIPAYDTYYDIPTITPPSEASGTKLPSTDLAWTVPTAGQTAGTELPSVTSTLGIPQITLSTNAPTYLPDLPATTATSTAGFSIASGTAATSTAADFPSVTNVFAIPTVSVGSAPAGVGTFGTNLTAQFIVPKPSDATTSTAQIVKGMTHDGTDYWFVVAGASNDSLIKVDGTNNSYISTSSASNITLPSTNFEGVAYSGGSLWLVEAKHRCYDDIENSMSDGGCNYQSRVYKIDGSDAPTDGAESSWVQTATGATTKVAAIYHMGEEWDQLSGIAAGDSGSLWIIDEFGNRFRNINANGIELNDYEGEWTNSDSLAFNKALLYTTNGSTITQWTDQGKKVQDWDTGVNSIKSMAIESDVVYIVSNNDGQVYAAFIGESVTQDSPRGVAYSASGSETALWILLDASPKDKLLKVDASTGALITNFSDDGIADAPSVDTEGITYFGGAIYIIANEGSGWEKDRKLYKVNATTGNLESGYPKDLGNFVWDDLGGLTNDGTNLVSWTKSNFNDVKTFDTNGNEVQSFWPCCPSFNGAKAIAYHSAREEYFVSSGTDLSIFDGNFNTVSDSTLALASSDTSAPSVTFASAQGSVFSGDDLFLVSGAQVYQTFLAAAITTKPLGIAWSASTAPGLGNTESLWVLVDAEPYDQILRIDTDDNELNTTFDTDGIADAPSNKTEGIVFLTEGNENYLYIIANDSGGDQWGPKQKNLYKVKIKDNSLVSGYPKNLENSGVWDDIGGMTYNGTNLIVTAKQNNGAWVVDTNGDKVSEGWPCCSSLFGMTAVAYHESRGVLYGGNQGKLVGISTDLNTIESEESVSEDGVNVSGIQGLTFGSDVLYVARFEGGQGYISSAALRLTLTTKPQAMVISPDDAIYLGQNIGEALWVVVDGSPKDRVLKLDISVSATTTLDTNFGSDDTKNGSAELPASNIKGLAFLDNYLYAVGDSGFDPHLYKLNPTSGAVIETYPLCGMMMMPGGGGGGGGMQVCESVGGMGQNATEMIMFAESMDNVWYVNTSGGVNSERWLPMSNMGSGADAVGYIASDNTFWSANGNKIQMWINPFGDEIFPAGNPHTVSAVQNIQGLGINQSTKEFWIGWHDDTDGFLSLAVPPSPITNTPLDLAYNADDGELYILVNGEGGDVVVAVNPSTGAILTRTDSDGNVSQRFGTVNSEDAYALAYHDGSIYVAYQERGFGGGSPPVVASERDPSDMSETRLFNLDSDCGKIKGLDSDGNRLLATVDHCGPKIETINASNGMKIQDVYFWQKGGGGFNIEGFDDVAYSTTTPQYFVIKSGQIYRIDDAGEVIDEWSVLDPDGNPTSNLTGLEFVGSQLYVADAANGKVYKGLVPLPTIAISNNPRALTTDGTNLWVAVDAEPVDKIIKMTASTSSASVITTFDSPGTETDGLAIHNGELWVLTNDTHNIEVPGPSGPQVMQMTVPTLIQVDPTTGEELFFSPLVIDTYGGQDILKDLVSGLASDGERLYTGSNGQAAGGSLGAFYTIDPNNYRSLCMFGKCFAAPLAEIANQFAGALGQVNSFQSFTVATTTSFADDRRLITAGAPNSGDSANRISRFDIAALTTGGPGGTADSVMYDQYQLPDNSVGAADIRGLAIVGTVMYMVDYGSAKLLGTSLPENTGVEMTVVGNYTTTLSATTDGGTFSGSASFSVVRNTDVRIQITSPADNFVATSSSATIAGRVNDPAITNVSVGIQLPSTSFIDDEVDTGGVSAALWTAATQQGDGSVAWGIDSSGSCPACGAAAWRFGKSGASSFDQSGSRVAGTLTSNDVLPVNVGTGLSFTTAWDTEFQAEMDQKFVQVASVTTDLQGNDVVGTYKNIAQLVQFVDQMFMPMPSNKHEDLFIWLQTPPLPFSTAQQHPVFIDLSPLAGQRIKVRFAFDSMDEFANEGLGWFVDNIDFSGSGTKTISIATVVLDPTVNVTYGTSTVTMYRSFSTTFGLAEGENTVIATAVQPYGPSLQGQIQTQGFVDTKDPVITLFNVPANTNNVQQTLKGTLVEPTIDKGGLMEIRHDVVNIYGTSSSAIVGKVTTEGEFSLFVSLQEGTNTFVATASDGGGRTATVSLVSVADLTAPVGTIEVITVTSEGEAVVGDQYFVLVAATDALSGVASSVLVSTGDAMVALNEVPAILREMHSLSSVGSVTTTHVTLAAVESGTPVGVNAIAVRVSDQAGNSTTIDGTLSVVAARTNRNFFLFPGHNFMGLALIPDDGDAGTSDDASLDRLMEQDVTSRVSQALIDHLATSTVTLGDVVESTFAFNRAGNFIVHTPGEGALDTLTELEPFQGMTMKTLETVGGSAAVFKEVSVAGFTAQQSVPIRVNIEGVFFRPGQLPPDKELRVGYNLVAPHTLGDTLFDSVFRGALIPRELAISALTFVRRVDAVAETAGITAEIFEGFDSASLGDLLNPVLSYWTFIVDDPQNDLVNDLLDPLGPTRTP